MKYQVVEANSAQALQHAVQELIDQGWKPQGGMSVATYAAGSWWYYQAVIDRDGD